MGAPECVLEGLGSTGSPAREQILKAESLESLREVVKAQVEADGRSLFSEPRHQTRRRLGKLRCRGA